MAMSTYAIEWAHTGTVHWTRPQRLTFSYDEADVLNRFDSFTAAEVQLNRYADYHGRKIADYRIVDVHTGARAVSAPGKDTEMATQPLNVTRTKLITALENAVKDEKAKADEARADALKAFDEAVAAVRENASVSVLNSVAGSASGYLNSYGKVGAGYTHDAVAKNETVEKQLRVLRLSEDKTVEVTPDNDFYRYL